MYKPWHLQRLEVQPGITGLQQVTSRSTANFDEQVRLDIDYIHRQSVWLDIMIILKTPFVILSTRGQVNIQYYKQCKGGLFCGFDKSGCNRLWILGTKSDAEFLRASLISACCDC